MYINTMLGIILVLLAMSSLAGASFKMGQVMASSPSSPDAGQQQQQYNVSLVVAAVAFMVALCGLLTASTGWNPFANLTAQTVARGTGSSLF